MALFLQHHFPHFPPPAPQPTAVNTLPTHRAQLLFPGHVHKWAPKVSHGVSLAHSLLVGGVGGVGWGFRSGAWGVGEAEPNTGYAPSALCGRFLPQKKLLPSRRAVQALGAVESFPHQQSFPCEPRLALLKAAPNPCQQHFKLWPAQCYILTGQALLA